MASANQAQDRLTQLQDCLDHLLTQMYATLKYIDTRHSYASIPGQPDQFTPLSSTAGTGTASGTANGNTAAPPVATTAAEEQQGEEQEQEPSGIEPVPDPEFTSKCHVLAQDLVLKEQQIEALVATLPGLGSSQARQETRIQELQAELDRLEAEARGWDGEREVVVGRLEGLLEGVCRV